MRHPKLLAHHLPAAAKRRRASRDFRHDALRAAARAVFARAGLDGATMRAIAAEAGYVPGAIYAYYPSKEAICADLLVAALADLGRAVRAALASAGGSPAERLREGAAAYGGFWQERPAELELLVQVLRRLRPGAVPAEIERQLTGRLIAALTPLAEAARACGNRRPEAGTLVFAAAVLGLTLLDASGRLAALGFAGHSLIDRAAADLLEEPGS